MKKLGNIIIDLLVVFAGVYMAFQLSDYKESRVSKRAELKYYKTFKQELETFAQLTENRIKRIDAYIQDFDSILAAGDLPRLEVQRDLTFPARASVVASAFNDGHFATLGQEFIVSISLGANLFPMIDQAMRDYQTRVKDLLYNKPYDANQFFENGALKPEYQWYIADLQVVKSHLIDLNNAINKGALPATEELIYMNEQGL